MGVDSGYAGIVIHRGRRRRRIVNGEAVGGTHTLITVQVNQRWLEGVVALGERDLRMKVEHIADNGKAALTRAAIFSDRDLAALKIQPTTLLAELNTNAFRYCGQIGN